MTLNSAGPKRNAPERDAAFAGYSRITGSSLATVSGPPCPSGAPKVAAAAADAGNPAAAIVDRPVRRNSLRFIVNMAFPVMMLCPHERGYCVASVREAGSRLFALAAHQAPPFAEPRHRLPPQPPLLEKPPPHPPGTPPP